MGYLEHVPKMTNIVECTAVKISYKLSTLKHENITHGEKGSKCSSLSIWMRYTIYHIHCIYLYFSWNPHNGSSKRDINIYTFPKIELDKKLLPKFYFPAENIIYMYSDIFSKLSWQTRDDDYLLILESSLLFCLYRYYM